MTQKEIKLSRPPEEKEIKLPDLIKLWIIQCNTLFEKHSPWDLQLASVVVGHALSMSRACWRDQCALWAPDEPSDRECPASAAAAFLLLSV